MLRGQTSHQGHLLVVAEPGLLPSRPAPPFTLFALRDAAQSWPQEHGAAWDRGLAQGGRGSSHSKCKHPSTNSAKHGPGGSVTDLGSVSTDLIAEAPRVNTTEK